MPTLSNSKGEETIVASKFETIRFFEATYILGALERMESVAEHKEEVKSVREGLLKLARRYGKQHLDADGHPKETPQQAAKNKV